MLAGCVNLSTKSAPQNNYSLSALAPPNVSYNKSKAENILEIYPPQIAPQFAGSNFVYRTNELNYTTDYYNVFFGFPAEQIQQNSIKYIQTTKIFKYASDNILPLKTDYILKTNITELYADYRDAKFPKAVISIQYTLINAKEQPKIVFSRTLNASIPLTEKSSNALVNGWNEGLQKILKRLAINLAASTKT
jgi:ABC-type uncharacterized transport system auxiliary subunit